jgi:IS605 OrfB family transposase
MEIARTATIKTDLDAEVVRRTQEAWAKACNYASSVYFQAGGMTTRSLHDECYQRIRSFGLSAQVSQSAIRQVKACYEALDEFPEHPVSFRTGGSVQLQGGSRGRDFSFTQNGLSVWTIKGRIKPVEFWGPPRLDEFRSEWALGDAKMFVRDENVYLAISFKSEFPENECPHDAVIGVDRGQNYLATVTDGKEVLFFGGGEVKQKRKHHKQLRAKLQRKKAQTGSRSLRRLLKRLSRKETRYMRDINHQISRRIVDFALETGNPTIALEDLSGIRQNTTRRKKDRYHHHSWAFYQLRQFITYKAQDHGLKVINVDPKNTSKGCSRCGHVEKASRKRHDFKCKACGYEVHSDYNAAKNIRSRGITQRQRSAA